jgi:predicted alpha-1,2-mannosidase
MVMNKILLFLFAATMLSCGGGKRYTESPADYVDMSVGTGGHGHVFMGANVPFGMVQLGPSQVKQGWDWTSGYHHSDSTIMGFGHLHLSGTGIGDLGDIIVMPVTEDVELSRGRIPDTSTGIYSFFSHANETARPGYYSVLLDRYGVRAELTATCRAGFHKYTFPEGADSRIIIDLTNGIGWDTPEGSYIEQTSDSTVCGYRYSSGWARDQRVYFHAEFSKPIRRFAVSHGGAERIDARTLTDTKVYGEASFETSDDRPLYVKVGVSPVSIDNARDNLEAELSGWDFDLTAKNAERAWNRELGKIDVQTMSESDKRVFYTALYHTMIAPSVFNDLNGEYRGADDTAGTYKSEGTIYTTFSLWDTYRAAHPLMTIIHPERLSDMAHTMIDIYRKQGKLPVWHLVGNETDCMVGNPGIPVLADMLLKGIDMDSVAALEAMRTSAMLDERDMKWINVYGYIPYDADGVTESVAKGLEYVLADWCVARVAERLGDGWSREHFDSRAKAYRYYFDPQTRFMRARSTDGEFREPFDSFRSSHRVDDYTEGNAWQYTWLVPHDVQGLITLLGGDEAFTAKLDSLFVVTGDLGDEASPDISGLIGQYAHGNEPSHHIPYLYAYAGEQWKSAETVRRILTTMYHDAPDGLSGNEDVGQMSAWYVLSALGFYQVAPAGGVYVFGSPQVERATIDVGGGRKFEIIARNNSAENIYIQSVKLNGRPLSYSYFTHRQITAGGTLEFNMSATPNPVFGSDPADRPVQTEE